MKLTTNTHLTDSQITALEGIGFNRWTKYGKDRLYADYEVIGLRLDRYNTGNISSAYLDGEKISNHRGGLYAAAISHAYIDVETGALHGISHLDRYGDEVKDRIWDAVDNIAIEA